MLAKQMVHGIMRDLEAEAIAYKRRTDAIRGASEALRAGEVARIAARYELESDQFYTVAEKVAIIKRGGSVPRY